MARTKKVNENMGDLIEALASFRSAEVEIRAQYARMADEKIAQSRDKVLDLMFIKHASSGPSEIANTTGVSRSTVIRWRNEWRQRHSDAAEVRQIGGELGVSEADAPAFAETVEKLVEAPAFEFSIERSEESNENVHVIVNKASSEKIYVIWGNTFTQGESADDSKEVARPDWLTDDALSQAEEATGTLIPGAIHR